MTDGTRPQGVREWVRTIAVYAGIGLAVYFANLQIQTWLGQRALSATELHSHALDDALRIAAADDKDVLVQVSAIWCTACRRVDKRVLSQAPVRQAIEEDFVFTRLEYESGEAEAFMEMHDVFGYPMFVVLAADGTLRRRLPLTFDPDQFIELLAAE